MASNARGRWHGRVWALAAFLAVLAGPPARALDPAKRVDQYAVDHWSSADLLGAKTVFAIRETHDGYLWLGSNAGLLRFDGFRFVLFEPANTPAFESPQVRALLETADGSLLVGVYGGGVVRLRDGRFERLGAGLPSQLVRALAAAADGGVWVGTQGGGVARLGADGALKERIARADGLPSDDVRAIEAGVGGELWIGTEPGGLVRRRGGALETFTTANGLLGDTVMALHRDAAGDLWVATTRGLHRFRDGAAGAAEEIARFTPADGLASDYLFSLGEDAQGNLWIGTGGAGLSRFSGGRFANLAAAGGLPDDYVWAFHEDRAGALWIGSEGGLTRLRDGLYTVWGQRQGLPADQVSGLLEDRAGALWLAGPKGLARFADGGVAVIGKAQGLPSDATRSLLAARDGALWVSTDGDGLARIAPGGAIATYGEKDGLGNAMVWSLAEDRDGSIWAGTQSRGLSRFAAGRWSVLSQKDGLGADNVRVVLAARAGGVWAGTFGGGLSRIEDGKVAATYTRRDGLGGDLVLSLYEDEDGYLWVGTLSGGLSLFAGGRLASFDRRRGFFADAIGGILGDDLGYLWLIAENGPFRVLRKDLLALFRDPAAGPAERLAVDVFGKAAGFLGDPGTGFTPNAFRRRDGRLLFATSRGANEIDPRRVRGPAGPAPPLVEGLVADHREVGLRPPPILPAGTLAVEIPYTAPSLDDPARTRFRYRLQGFDRDWVEVGERRVAYYPNLPPGDFTFRVAARGADGEWRESAPLPLTLLPYFYQTGWFKVLLAALGAGALYGLYRLRAGRLEARAAVAEERNRLAREIHDTLAQDLAAILMHARLGQRAGGADAGAPFFEDIAALATGSLAEARRSLQALRPPALDGKTLAQALRETAESLTGRGAAITFRAEGDGEPAPAVEVELLRIAKEAMGNALRHGGARKIEVELRCGRDELVLAVADDGAGFEPRAALGGFGLIGMRERAAALGGTLEVTSAPGHGARVVATAPTRGKEP